MSTPTADADVFDALAAELGDTNVDTASLMPDVDLPSRNPRKESPAAGQRVGNPGSVLVGIGEARQDAMADMGIVRLISPGWRANTGGADLVIAYAMPDPDLFTETIGKVKPEQANRAGRRRAGAKQESGSDRHAAWLIGCAVEVYLTRGDVEDPDHERIHPSGDTDATVMPAIDADLAALFGVDTPEEACTRLFLRPGAMVDHSLDVMAHAGYLDDPS